MPSECVRVTKTLPLSRTYSANPLKRCQTPPERPIAQFSQTSLTIRAYGLPRRSYTPYGERMASVCSAVSQRMLLLRIFLHLFSESFRAVNNTPKSIRPKSIRPRAYAPEHTPLEHTPLDHTLLYTPQTIRPRPSTPGPYAPVYASDHTPLNHTPPDHTPQSIRCILGGRGSSEKTS